MRHLNFDNLMLVLNGILLGLYFGPKTDSHMRKIVIQGEATQYVQQFIERGHELGHDVSLQDLIVMFGDDAIFEPRQLAVCHVEKNETPEIYVRTSTWNKMGPWDRREVMFHELTHCLLGRDHDDTKLSNGMPKSIMTTVHSGPRVYNQNTASQYDAELFGVSK